MFFDIIQNITNTKENINRRKKKKKLIIKRFKNILNSF